MRMSQIEIIIGILCISVLHGVLRSFLLYEPKEGKRFPTRKSPWSQPMVFTSGTWPGILFKKHCLINRLGYISIHWCAGNCICVHGTPISTFWVWQACFCSLVVALRHRCIYVRCLAWDIVHRRRRYTRNGVQKLYIAAYLKRLYFLAFEKRSGAQTSHVCSSEEGSIFQPETHHQMCLLEFCSTTHISCVLLIDMPSASLTRLQCWFGISYVICHAATRSEQAVKLHPGMAIAESSVRTVHILAVLILVMEG